MTISYPDSDIESFALASFYYGCLITGKISLPVPCTITVTGYGAGSSEPVAVQTFTFSPAAGWVVPLTFGVFGPAFQGLQHVTYVQSPAAGTEFVVDNIVGAFST